VDNGLVIGGNASPDSPFIKWNDALARQFFNKEMADRSVHLNVNEELIRGIALKHDLHVDSFCGSLIAGAPWDSTKKSTISQRAFAAFKNWRKRELTYPPYIGYLSLFVYAGGIPGKYATNAYYPKLRDLIGLPFGSTLPSFDKMIHLWDDLERWSIRDQKGCLGLFTATISGRRIHVGLPLSQSVLTEAELAVLPSLFAALGLDPETNVTRKEIVSLLSGAPNGTFRRKTLALSMDRSASSVEMRQALFELITSVLANWDGKFDRGVQHGEVRLQKWPIRIAIDVDEVRGVFRSGLRVKFPRDSTYDEPLYADGPEFPTSIRFQQETEDWSGLLLDPVSQVGAATLDWVTGTQLKLRSPSAVLDFPGRAVRIFRSGINQHLRGYLEIHSVPDSQPLVVAYHQSIASKIESWLSKSCRGVSRISITSGIPPEWCFARVDEVFQDDAIADSFPWLAVPDNVQVRFIGGIRVSVGSTYFRFALPTLLLQGTAPADRLYVNNLLLTPDSNGSAALVADEFSDVIKVEVRRNDVAIARRTLFISDLVETEELIECTLDKWGVESIEGISGPEAPVCADSGIRDWEMPIELTQGKRYLLVGTVPGQIAEWNSLATMPLWDAAWAIEISQGKSIPLYCAPEDSAEPGSVNPARRDVARWKEVLWYRRKQYNLPPIKYHRELFVNLQRSARDV